MMNFRWRDKYKINLNYQFYLLIPFKLGYEVLVVLQSWTYTPFRCVLGEVSFEKYGSL